MSIYSDYACGALSDEEFRSYGAYENRKERYFEERQMLLDSLSSQCDDCQYKDEETGECEYGFKYTNCPELGSGEG